MKRLRTPCLRLIVLLEMVVVSGCQPGELQGELTGRVTLNGEPVSQGYVIFRNYAKGVHMMAEIGADGTYRASTANGYGLPLGEYQVYVSPPVPDVPFGPAMAPPDRTQVAMFPKKYQQPETSELSITIREGDNRLDIAMVR